VRRTEGKDEREWLRDFYSFIGSGIRWPFGTGRSWRRMINRATGKIGIYSANGESRTSAFSVFLVDFLKFLPKFRRSFATDYVITRVV